MAAVILYAYAYSLFASMANRLPFLRPVMPPRPQPVTLRQTTRPRAAPSTNGTAIQMVLPADEPVLMVLPAEEPMLMVTPAEEPDERVRAERG